MSTPHLESTQGKFALILIQGNGNVHQYGHSAMESLGDILRIITTNLNQLIFNKKK